MAREASHAGSWYTDDAKELDGELEGWLGSCHIQGSPMARAIIAPHAGFRYSGRCAAFAFAQIDPASVSRIFLLGPSHHHFTKGCCLSPARVYRTPLGDAPVDQEVYAELKATGRFEMMSASVDAAEHSLEMHLPYLVKVMNGRPFTLVPIMVGALSPDGEALFGGLLAKYMSDSRNFFSVSSDFCHWGTRFHYHPFDQERDIFKRIEGLDRTGMDLIELMQKSQVALRIKFVQYEQSSRCRSLRDSSVSYASGVAFLVDS
eukprot:TRINITY_DN3117_c0_g1_i2.p1 TRINITY_DN3117_c0_g1~~TRINITY_DN3117_c0_g1_i2.p1  ORF type:complete len:261 (-),score=25.09 TRINITY_DN3117_c0_g1_i2:655-1437(-)